MGYIFLLLALLAGTTKAYCSKKTSNEVVEPSDAFMMNAIRMVLCVSISFVMLCITGNTELLKVNGNELFIAICSGVATSVFVVAWFFVVKKGAYMMVEVFLMLGCMFPIISSAVLFQEKIEIKHLVGFTILLAATNIMCSYNNAIKSKMKVGELFLLLLCAFANGSVSLTQKIFATQYSNGNAVVFNFYTYVFALLTLMICNGLSSLRKKSKTKMKKSILGYIFVASVCLFANSYFMTLAAKTLPAMVLYPLCQGIALVFSSLMAAVAFKERISTKSVIGMAAAFIGLVVINLL